MDGFVGRRAWNDASGFRANVHEMAGYTSDSSSGDESIISVIPNKPPAQPSTSYNSAIKRDSAFLMAAQRPRGERRSSDADLEIVKSDISQPRIPQIHAEGAGPTVPLPAMKKRKASVQDFADSDYEEEDAPPSKRIAAIANRSHADSSAVEPHPDPDMSGYSSQQLGLWEYIQPYLTFFRNRPIPKRCWLPDLLALPRVRDLSPNPRRPGERGFVDRDEKSLAALVLFMTGKKVTEPCSNCIKGKGVFVGCVKLPANTLLGVNIRNCANCWFSHQACTSKKVQDDHLMADEDDGGDADGRNDSAPVADSDAEGINETSQHLQEETGAQGPRSRSRPPPILRALSGRPYCEWPDKSGSLVTLKGNVLLPDGYEGGTDATNPYTCPVYDCNRRPFAHLRGLGFHFPRTHHGQMLNDNCDGTFSVVGSYDDRKLGNGGAYPDGRPSFPYVVSRNPKGRLRLKRRAAASPVPANFDRSQDNDSDGGTVAKHLPIPDSGTQEPSELMWDYIKPHLKKTTTIPDKGWVKELLPLPRVRNLRWNPDRASDWHETHPRDISCMIIQVTGDAAPQPCSKCANGKGPFAGCVVISRDAPPHVRARMVSCANCNYHNRQVDCSLIDWVVSRPQPPWPGYLGKGGQPVVRPSADSAPPMPAASPEKSRKPDRRQPALIPPGDRELTASGRAGLDASSEPRARTKTTEPARGRLVAPPAATLLRRPNAEEVVEMQDWEIAPGYIRGQTSGTQGSNIAESGAYLSCGRPSQISNTGVEVELVIVSMGAKKSFAAMADRVRSCTVIEGRLKVKIGEDAVFTLGPRGRFQIPRGVSAWVQNKLYSEAVFDMYTAKEYD